MLTPYTGPWGFAQAAHLLRRTIYGPSRARIEQAVAEGLDGSINTLVNIPVNIDPPIYYDYEEDPTAGLGESWAGQPIDDALIIQMRAARNRSLWAWWLKRMHTDDQSIGEKMIMFWHNHFVVSINSRPNFNWFYLQRLRNYALGNFRELTKEMTIDQSMLIFLNGTENLSFAPNENYARELLELFTIGKGPVVAPGDYSTYTELDVQEIAKALTGWYAWTNNTWQAAFLSFLHNNTTKQLSHRFDNQQIPNAGDNEYKNVIDIIFGKDEVAHHICRRLYIWFVNYRITPAIESQIITPMAQILLDNDYEIRPALEALLKSEHFFSEEVRGCMIKNPFDYFYSVFKSLDSNLPDDILDEYEFWRYIQFQSKPLGMELLQLPSVAGWRAYHQAPNFYRDWINSASIGLRKELIQKVNPQLAQLQPGLVGIDPLAYIATLSNPQDVNQLLNDLSELFYPNSLTDEQKTFFKNILIPGLPDFEWTVEYNEYLDDPTNDEIRIAVTEKLNDLFSAMLDIPEFHLS